MIPNAILKIISVDVIFPTDLKTVGLCDFFIIEYLISETHKAHVFTSLCLFHEFVFLYNTSINFLVDRYLQVVDWAPGRTLLINKIKR